MADPRVEAAARALMLHDGDIEPRRSFSDKYHYENAAIAIAAADAADPHREQFKEYVAATSGPIGRLRCDYPDHEAVQALYAAIKQARAALDPKENRE